MRRGRQSIGSDPGAFEQPTSFAVDRPTRLHIARVVSSIKQLTRRRFWHQDQTGGKRLRICLFGYFGGGNFGNDASLQSMLLIVREAWPEAELSCVCHDPRKIERQSGIPAIAISATLSGPFVELFNKVALRGPAIIANWVRAVRHIRQVDMLIVTGTSTLCDYRATPLDMPYGLFRWAVAARLCGTKLCFVRTGAGPIYKPATRWMLKRVARLAHYRSFRDEVSREFIAGLGIDTRTDPVYPDLVFKVSVRAVADRNASQPISIGVGVMEYCGWEYVTVEQRTHSLIYREYISKITLYIRSLLDRGYVVRLLIGELADLRAVEDIVGKLQEKRCRLTALTPPAVGVAQLIAEPIRSLDDVITQIANTDIVVASRYHNVVCALRMARPTISIGYEAKNDAVMTKLGLGEFCQRISDLDVTKLQSQTQELLRDISFYEQQTRQYLEQFLCQMAEREEIVRLAALVAPLGP